jgi:hypothetical protein
VGSQLCTLGLLTPKECRWQTTAGQQVQAFQPNQTGSQTRHRTNIPGLTASTT